jgi:hypothetical protein
MRRCQVLVYERVRELRRDRLSRDQHPVVDGTDELVDREVDVGVIRQFAAASRAPEGRAVTVALRRHELRAEAGRDLRVVLRLPRQCAANRARIGLGQEHGQLAQVMAQVAAEVIAVVRGEVRGRVLRQGVEEDVGLRRPPAIDGLLGDLCTGRDPLDGDPSEPALGEDVVSGLQDSHAGFLAPPVAVAVVSVDHLDRVPMPES